MDKNRTKFIHTLNLHKLKLVKCLKIDKEVIHTIKATSKHIILLSFEAFGKEHNSDTASLASLGSQLLPK